MEIGKDFNVWMPIWIDSCSCQQIWCESKGAPIQSSYHQTCKCQHFKGKEHNADGGQCHWCNLFQRHQLLQPFPAPCLSRISYAQSPPAPLVSANNYRPPAYHHPHRFIISPLQLVAKAASSSLTWLGVSHGPLSSVLILRACSCLQQLLFLFYSQGLSGGWCKLVGVEMCPLLRTSPEGSRWPKGLGMGGLCSNPQESPVPKAQDKDGSVLRVCMANQLNFPCPHPAFPLSQTGTKPFYS